jgi:peptidoglycan-N-acetylglucosamine deacetylase
MPVITDTAMESHDPYGRDRDQWPLYRSEGTSALLEHITSFLGNVHQRSLPAVVFLCFHPWESVETPLGPIHYGERSVIPDEFVVPNCSDVALRELGKRIEALQLLGARFTTAAGLAQAWPA